MTMVNAWKWCLISENLRICDPKVWKTNFSLQSMMMGGLPCAGRGIQRTGHGCESEVGRNFPGNILDFHFLGSVELHETIALEWIEKE